MICAGTADGDKDSCYGDSGGPLVVSDGGDGWLQAGVVSWGAGCALKGSYGVYTNIPQFTDWVQDYLNGDEPKPTPQPTPVIDDGDTDDGDTDDGDTDDEEINDEELEGEGDEIAFVDWVEIAAQTIGIDVETVDSLLMEGKTIADIAKANNVDVQNVIDALQSAEDAFIQQLTDEGAITEDEAAEWMAELPAMLDEFVNQPITFEDDEWDEFPEDAEFVDWFDVAAQTIGMDVDTLFEQVDQGQSIADVATANDADPQTIIDALVAAETEFIQTLLTDETITQEEADEWTAATPDDAASFVNETFEFDEEIFTEGEEGEHCDDEHGDDEHGDADEDESDESDSGDASYDDDGYELENEYYDGDDDLDDSDEGNLEGSSDDDDFDDEMEWVDWFEVAARTLNMDADQLFEALDQGQSIAEIATANNVDDQAIVDAIVSAEQAMIEQGIADGLFPQDEADEWLAELPEVATHFIEDAEGCTDADMIEGVDWFMVAAQTIGLDEETFWNAVEQGLSIAEVATANGSDSQSVIDAIVQAETDLINQEVASDLISQDDGDEWLVELSDFVTDFVEMGFMDDAEFDDKAELDGASGEKSNNSEGGMVAIQSASPTTIQAASMTLVLQKNARAKTPATFPDNFIYLPMVMK